MRNSLLACIFVLTGCVSQSQPGMLSDNFDTREAAKTRMSLGLTYLKNGNYSQAKQNLDKALEFAPRLAQVHYAMAYYYQTVEDKARAVEFYQNAMDLAPRDADIANSYGAYLCEQGDYEQANAFFTKAIQNQRYANAVLTHENMGICAQKRGFHDDAINHFNDALNHQPSRAKTLFLLAQAYADSERWKAAANALKRYEKVASISPDSLWLAVQIAHGRKDYENQRAYGTMLTQMFPESRQAKAYEALRSDQPVLKRRVKSTTDSNDTNSQAITSGRHSSDEAATVPAKMVKTSPSNAEQAAQPRFHIVQADENLYRISLRYNIKLSTLRVWNELDESDALLAGTKLWLVPPQQQNN